MSDSEEQILTLLILVVIFLLLFYVIGHINRSTLIDYCDSVIFLNQIDLKNGDLVGVSYNHFAGVFVSSLTHSIWSHTGTIWIDPLTNIKYVLEGANYNHEKYQRFFKIPFDTWMYFNRKNIIGYKKYNGPEIDSNFMWSIYEKFYNNGSLEGFSFFWTRFLNKRSNYFYFDTHQYTCIESTVILGQEIGIYSKDIIYSSYLPCDIMNNVVKTNRDIYYSKTIELKLNSIDLSLIEADIEKNKKFWKKLKKSSQKIE